MEDLQCLYCGRRYEYTPWIRKCRVCGGPLAYPLAGKSVARRVLEKATSRREHGVWSFTDILPIDKPGPSLGEAWTPTLRADNVASLFGVGGVFLKAEHVNPTGTFIDRGSAVELWAASRRGYRVIVSGGLGDHTLSVAAYAARLGLRLYAHVAGRLDLSRFYRIVLTGASVQEEENYGKALLRAERHAKQRGAFPSLPLSPERIDGYRTIIYEVYSTIKGVDALIVPMGDGILASAVYKALLELEDLADKPRVYVARLQGSGGPGLDEIGVSQPLAGLLVERLTRETSGRIVSVEPSRVYKTMVSLARLEGIVADPAGAAGLAALQELANRGELGRSDSVLVVLSGASSRDPLLLLEALRTEKTLLDRAERTLLSRDIVLGDTKRQILELIARHGQLHAYQVWKLLQREGLELSMPTVYQHLWSLEKAGLVEKIGEGARGRKLYRLTPRGYEVLQEYSQS